MSENSETENRALRATLELSYEMETLIADIRKHAHRGSFVETYQYMAMLSDRVDACLELLEEDIEPEPGEDD